MTPTNEYGQEPPTEREAIGALAELVGEVLARGIWNDSARALGLEQPIDRPDDLRLMADHLMNVGEMMRVSARSTKVRVLTYTALMGSGAP